MRRRPIDSEDVRTEERPEGWAVVIVRLGSSNPVGARLLRGLNAHPLLDRILTERPVGLTKPAADALAADWVKVLRAQEKSEA